MGPQLQTRSTYSLPSTSNRYAPCARSMNRGVPPTALNARTGELTPPGVTPRARSKSAAEVVGGTGLTAPLCPPQRRDHEPPPAVTSVRSVTPQPSVTHLARRCVRYRRVTRRPPDRGQVWRGARPGIGFAEPVSRRGPRRGVER